VQSAKPATNRPETNDGLEAERRPKRARQSVSYDEDEEDTEDDEDTMDDSDMEMETDEGVKSDRIPAECMATESVRVYAISS